MAYTDFAGFFRISLNYNMDFVQSSGFMLNHLTKLDFTIIFSLPLVFIGFHTHLVDITISPIRFNNYPPKLTVPP